MVELSAPKLKQNLLIVGAAVLAYATLFWPNRLVLKYGLKTLGYPPYSGFIGAFLPHLLLYSTLPALACALLWVLLNKMGSVPAPELGRGQRALYWGLLGGVASLVLTLAVAWAIFPAGTMHWVDPAPWKIAGNAFSNFFEEFIFRGFILVALRAAIGFWPAAVISSVLWAALHTQYPIAGQLSIAVIGVGYCWIARHAKSLWAPYFSHMFLDVTADSLLG